MRPFTPPRMHVVRKEEKEARLLAFIAEQLSLAASGDAPAPKMTVIARAFDSPVLKALARHADQIRGGGLELRVIVVLAEGAADEVTALLAGATTRCGCDARLLDAHEQLALGGQTVWIGDCMRREPSKRDAYEIYSAGCAETAAVAHRSFERVWAFAGAGRSDVAPAPQPAAVQPAPVAMPIAALAEGEAAPIVSTRH